MADKQGFFKRLVSGLTKSRDGFASDVDTVFHGYSKIDDDFYEGLEETLIMGDLGVTTTEEIIDELKTRFCEMASQYKKVMTPELQQTIQEYYKKHDN